MLYYAEMFVFLGLIAGGLNWAGIAMVATQGSWTLLVSGIILLMMHWIAERPDRASSQIRSIAEIHE